jgi:hypothetical protein
MIPHQEVVLHREHSIIPIHSSCHLHWSLPFITPGGGVQLEDWVTHVLGSNELGNTHPFQQAHPFYLHIIHRLTVSSIHLPAGIYARVQGRWLSLRVGGVQEAFARGASHQNIIRAWRWATSAVNAAYLARYIDRDACVLEIANAM